MLELRTNADGERASAGECLDELAIAELAEGLAAGERGRTAIAHLSECGRCRQELASVASALAEPKIQRELATLERKSAPARRRLLGLGGAVGIAAAAVAILVIGWPSQEPAEAPPSHRDPLIATTASPTAVAPVGAVDVLTSLVWTSVPRADLYAVTLFDAEGIVIWDAETGDSFAFVPDSVPVQGGAVYYWRVRARTGFDRWAESHLTEFTLAPSPNGAQ